MLKNRIISTLKFFDLQDYPVTLLELHEFLIEDLQILRTRINTSWELINESVGFNLKVNIDEVLKCLETECQNEVRQKNGFYCLQGRINIIDQRLANYIYGIKRERRIRRFIGGLGYLPFVRGAALAGSQAMGQQKEASDIDLLIIVEPKFLWLGRTLVTAYFQILGMRRHGKKISNRFCLNHYLGGIKTISELRNLYTAWEYIKLRPLAGRGVVKEFQLKNYSWTSAFFPNLELKPEKAETATGSQKFFETLLSGKFGSFLENQLRSWQLPKIRREEFILVRQDELSFHPQSKQEILLNRFFEF